MNNAYLRNAVCPPPDHVREKLQITPLNPRDVIAAPRGTGETWAVDAWGLEVPYGVALEFAGQDVFSAYLEGEPLDQPAAPSLAVVTGGGALPAGTYNVQVTAVSALGQTDAAPVVSLAVALNDAIEVTWPAVTGALSHNIYLSADSLPLLVGNFPSSPQIITVIGTGVAAPTVNTAHDEMPPATQVRIVHRGIMTGDLGFILPVTNYENIKPFVDQRKLRRLNIPQTRVQTGEVIAIQVNGLAVSGHNVLPRRSRFRLSGHRVRVTI